MKRRALIFTGPRQVEVRDEALPAPGAGQVLVHTLVSAISAGTELLIYRGQAPAELPADETLPALGGTLAFPLTYGYAAVGRVAALGRGVAPTWEGRRVFAFQPHASHFVAPLDQLLPLPENVTPDEAACLPSMETAVNFVHDGRPLLGEQVVVFGQGVVGLLTTALLARLPLAGLVTVDPIDERRRHSLTLGAGGSVEPGPAAELAERIAQAGGPAPAAGADLTYELSGQPAALDQAIGITGYAGRVVVGSWYGRKAVTLDLGGRFHRSRIRLLASQVSRLDPPLSGRWTNARRLAVAWQMLALVRPASLVTHRFAVEDAAAAYALLDAQPATALQVLLTY